MTIDERLERLTERHEALAQSLELLATDVREVNQSITALRDAVYALLTIVGNHERRLQRLEGGGTEKAE